VPKTPYGITRTSFVALHPDWKYDGKSRLVRANSQHYRVQADETNTSIGEAVRQWFGIRKIGGFERIDVDATIHPEGHFILIPTALTRTARNLRSNSNSAVGTNNTRSHSWSKASYPKKAANELILFDREND
jgi:hypothetical protein